MKRIISSLILSFLILVGLTGCSIPVINPDGGTSKIDIPDIDFSDIDLPDIEIPDINLEDIDFPEINLPEINIPRIDIPDFSEPNEISSYTEYHFRNEKLLSDHYKKHGIDMGFASEESYEEAASDVINNPNSLSKTEKEDGDYVYYLQATNEFVILSTDGYIRTYFLPDDGIAYYDRQ